MLTISCQHANVDNLYNLEMKRRHVRDLSQAILKERKSRKWSQEQLAKKVDVSRPSIAQWESGSTKNLRNENLLALADAFEISTDELLTGSPYPQKIATEAYLALPSEIAKMAKALQSLDDDKRQEIINYITVTADITNAKSADERKKIIVEASIADDQRTEAKNTAQEKNK